MKKTTGIYFFQRTFPSANMVFVKDNLPLLIDTGFGSDIRDTEELIKQTGTLPEELKLIINTHYHSDHVGGNHHLQKKYGVNIAAHKWDADLINSRDPEVCSAEWLDQPVEPYQVQMKVTDGDEIDTGNRVFQVIHTPGHTLGHISLYEPDEKVLICGDLFHKQDVGWLNIFREGIAAVQRSMESLEQLSKLSVQHAYSGHGPEMENPMESMDSARKKYEKWLNKPEKISWHACKRIFAYSLMLYDGLPEQKIKDYLISCGWFCDFARYTFQLTPEEFIRPLLDEMIRSGAAIWSDGVLVASTAYKAPDKEWMLKDIKPKNWIKEL